jgi:UDP-3-O-[3-hydroxymyristoyl] N-acetylglucosamine deacetylase
VQTTVANKIEFLGVGLHAGQPAKLAVLPAEANTGIVFRRTDIQENNEISAIWSNVNQEPLNTRLVNEHGVSVCTIEHLMAAFAGTGLHNAVVEIDGPEVPILDGSSAPFVRKIVETGLKALNAPLRAIKVLEHVEVIDDEVKASFSPAQNLQIAFHIDFPDPAIGRQDKVLNMANGAFVRELCDSRTFCRNADIEFMHGQGLALGGTLSNAVVVDHDRVLSPGGLRHADEPVRHKMLDALGDLYTAGAPILGRYTGVRAGHAMTNKLLRALFDRPDAWEWVEVDAATAAYLPGVGVKPEDLDRVA